MLSVKSFPIVVFLTAETSAMNQSLYSYVVQVTVGSN